jgi:hypothetical protein
MCLLKDTYIIMDIFQMESQIGPYYYATTKNENNLNKRVFHDTCNLQRNGLCFNIIDPLFFIKRLKPLSPCNQPKLWCEV